MSVSLYLAYAFLILPFLGKKNAVNAENIPVVDAVITTITSGGTDTGGNGSTGIALTEAPATTPIYVRGQASHGDGCTMIGTGNATWTAKTYRTGATGASEGAGCGIADRNDCYATTAVILANCEVEGDYAVDYEFNLEFFSWADPTDAGSTHANDTWTAKVSVESGGATGTLSDEFEIGSTVALTLGSGTVNYGSFNLGSLSADDIPLVITNSGNRAIDLQISASGDMACDGAGSGPIPTSNAKYALTASTTYAAMAALSTTTATVDISITARTSESTASTGTIYNKIQIPSSGVSGSCSNTVTYTAVAEAGGGGGGPTSSGPNSPNTAIDDKSVGSVEWTDPQHVFSENASSTYASLISSDSHYLKTTGYGFNIPANATINGIILAIKRSGYEMETTVDSSVKLVNAGSVIGANKASATAWPETATYATYGSSSDTWGRTWTASEINASDFGAAISATGNGSTSSGFIDHMRITVHYTP